MGGSLLFKAEIPGSSLLGHLPKEFPCVLPGTMVNRILWSPEGLVEVRVSWPGHPRYQKKKKKICNWI